jgi:hypothetical protein
MDPTTESSGKSNVWQGGEAPCVYCGQVISRTEERCPHCRTSMSVAVRRASREVIGPWYYLDARNPSGRGVTFETLIKMIEKGRIRHDSIVRGPTTHQDWLYAAEAPRLAKYLGVCPHCFGEAKPEDTYCTRCQLNMNSRPAESRPGVPESLVKPPFHKAAYDIEKQLATDMVVSQETLDGQSLDAPLSPPRAEPAMAVSRPVSRGDSARGGLAATTPAPSSALRESSVAALSAATAAADRSAHVSRRRKPKLWVVMLLTWGTLGGLVAVLYFSGLLTRVIPAPDGTTPSAKNGGPDTVSTPVGNSSDQWLSERLREVDKAVAVRDFAKAIELYETILAKTNDPAWNARIDDMKKRAAEDRKDRVAKLKSRLESAENLARERKFDDSVAVLRNIGKDDRQFLASIGVGVDMMERQIREDQAKWEALQRQDADLKKALGRVQDLRNAKKNEEALAAMKAIKTTFMADMIQKQAPTFDADLQALDAAVAAVKPKEPVKVEPPKVEVTAEQAAPIIADLMKQAAELEKTDKLDDALAKLQEIKTRFPKTLWPETLDDRIKTVEKKIEALKFFGIDSPPPPPKKK